MSFINANQLIQQFISNYGNTGRTYQAIDFVQAVSNANNMVNIDPNTFIIDGGKKRSVRLNYFPILCDVDGECGQGLCTTGEVIEPKQILFEITRCTATKKFGIRKDDIRLVDNGAWDFNGTARQIIASALPALRRQLAIDWVTRLLDLAGVHPDGNDTHRISVTNPTNGIVNPLGKFDIQREFMDAGFQNPYILGDAEVYNWQKMVGIGGLNAQGQNINQLSTEDSFYDDGLLNAVLNNLASGGNILAIAPETFKYVWFLKNAGIFRTDMISIDDMSLIYRRGMDGFIEGTLVDPVTGIPFDLFLNYNKCDQRWDFHLEHTWEFFVMPDVACNTQGVNGIFRYRTCAPVIAPCPTGDSPASPTGTEQFSWTPTLADLPTISQSVIGGYEMQSNEPTIISSLANLRDYMNANSQITFSVSGSDIVYTGYTAITATFNNADVTATFS